MRKIRPICGLESVEERTLVESVPRRSEHVLGGFGRRNTVFQKQNAMNSAELERFPQNKERWQNWPLKLRSPEH